MAQPEFHRPECFDGSTTDEIHERMMASLPDDIDDMPAGFPYDFTRPAAEEKSEFINYHLIRAVMLAFPQPLKGLVLLYTLWTIIQITWIEKR